MTFKRLSKQTIVITGATSGIGLATARMAARRGANVVISGRSEHALQQLADELNTLGTVAVPVVGDVTHYEDLHRLRQTAIDSFGDFDTWINNAGTSIFGELMQVPLEEQRQLFDVNFWSVVMGSQLAAEHFQSRARNGGGHYTGKLINLGSVLSDRAIPLQGTYSATKAAVKSYTDALRMELHEHHVPVSVTLIQPAAINTPFPEHARNYMEAQPRLAGPVYQTSLVAEAILDAAQRNVRQIMIGGAGKMLSTMAQHAPSLTDRYMEATMFEGQKRKVAIGGRVDSLAEPSEDLREEGHHDGPVKQTSLYTAAARRPGLSIALLLVGGGLLAHSVRRSST